MAKATKAESPPPVSVPTRQLCTQNQRFLDMALRRLREMLTEAQSRRADGRITLDVHVADGILNGNIHYRPDWVEQLARQPGVE